MKGKIAWLMLVCLTVFPFVIASCAPKAQSVQTTQPPQTSAEANTVQVTLTKRDGTKMTRSVPKPTYGGTITAAISQDYSHWDPYHCETIQVGHMQFTSEKMLQGNWTLGPQGTGDTDWALGWLGDIKLMAPSLCSWTLPDSTTIDWHLRQGVHWQNKAPVNGREMTADDLVWNWNYQFNNKGTWQMMEYPPGDPLRPVSWKVLDKYTAQVKFSSTEAQSLMLVEMGTNIYMSPPEVWENGGNMDSWQKVVGSGPWLLTDYVAGSAITYSRNPNYWEDDPIYATAGLKYQLPYLDHFVQLVIPDQSTQYAALRTAKLDYLIGVDYDSASQLMSELPDLQSKQGYAMAPDIAAGLLSKAPFSDIRVRQALNMAVDKQNIVTNLFKGKATLVGYPYPPAHDWSAVYTPLNQLPQDAQELYQYNPDKAKQLLAEAGYPDGFKTQISCSNGDSTGVSELQIVKADLAKVNVDLSINVMDPTTFDGIWMGVPHKYDGMLFAPGLGSWAGVEMLMTRKGMGTNFAEIDDPYYVTEKDNIAKYVISDPDKMLQVKKAAAVHELESAWGIFMPSNYVYNLWWPWMDNYDGINWTGAAGQWIWSKNIWEDQNLKKSMGH